MDETVVGYIAAMLMGVMLGVLGAGGSVLTVPILVYLCGTNPVLASSYSLCVVGITALVGAVQYARSSLVSYQAVLLFGVPSVLGVVVARGVLLPRIPEEIFEFNGFLFTRDLMILVIFALLMVAAGLAMVFQRTEEDASQATTTGILRFNAKSMLGVASEGFLVGLVTGLVGAGGGFIIVPALVMLVGLPIRVAIGTSLAIIFVKSICGVAVDSSFWREVDWRFLLQFSAAAILGIVFGGLISNKIPARPLKMAFGWFVLVLGAIIITKELLL